MIKPGKYIRYLFPIGLFSSARTKQILNTNPVTNTRRTEPDQVVTSVYHYNEQRFEEFKLDSPKECAQFKRNDHITWINIDGLKKAEVEKISEIYGIHPLISEDILSIGQRPKMDEIDEILYCLLNMLYYNEQTKTVEQEQVSIVLGKNFVITFQEDPLRDVFNPIRDKLKIANSKVRMRGADYLCYSMIDLIVDNYFYVMESLGDQIEAAEEEIIQESNKRSLAQINHLRKELIVLKRNIAPVRDLVASIIRSENQLLDENTARYFKDVHDHISQAFDLSENYRDVMISMQDLYINNVNLKMNEVMKVLAIVTCLLAPATVIGGIFGMNFDIIPTMHNKWGFYTAVSLMFVIPAGMLYMFRRRGWF